MGKNIVICCDGTGNEHSESNTNVGFFFEAIDHDASSQIAFYDAGVGTFGPFGGSPALPVGRPARARGRRDAGCGRYIAPVFGDPVCEGGPSG